MHKNTIRKTYEAQAVVAKRTEPSGNEIAEAVYPVINKDKDGNTYTQLMTTPLIETEDLIYKTVQLSAKTFTPNRAASKAYKLIKLLDIKETDQASIVRTFSVLYAATIRFCTDYDPELCLVLKKASEAESSFRAMVENYWWLPDGLWREAAADHLQKLGKEGVIENIYAYIDTIKTGGDAA